MKFLTKNVTLALIIACVILSDIMAQNNLVSNPGFENGNYGSSTTSGAFQSCKYFYKKNKFTDFNDEIDNWFVAEHNINWGMKGYDSPQWINKNNVNCQSFYSCFNPTSNHFVYLHQADQTIALIPGKTNDAIMVLLKEPLSPNTKYVFRVRIYAINNNNHLRVRFSTITDKWWKTNNKNFHFEDINANKVRAYMNCQWKLEETTITTPSSLPKPLNYLILYSEQGSFYVDDIELFKKCPDVMLVENKIYDSWYYKPINLLYPPFIEWSANSLIAGRDIDPNQTNGDVVIQNDADITFRAGTKIELLPGFRTETGAKFTAEILPCPNYRLGNFEDSTVAFENMDESLLPVQKTKTSNTPFYFSLYPNPNTGAMQIDCLLDNEQSGELTIYDVTGRRVKHFILSNQSNTLKIAEGELTGGVYYYNVNVNDEIVVSEKLIIVR